MLENSFEFIQDNICCDELVLCEDNSNDIGTEPARRKPADENIGIEKDLHDTALKTSSSVRKPRASAKGMALWRSCSNVINESCRRSASRTTSLRFRLERRQNLLSIRSRSWSSRIVTAFLMSHNVLQIPCKRKRETFALFLIRHIVEKSV
jgi:hypothetical protein